MARETLVLNTPITWKTPSKYYGLIISDAEGNDWFFNKDGTYDGHGCAVGDYRGEVKKERKGGKP